MARRTPKPEAQFTTTLTPLRKTCEQCGNRLWVAYHCRRKVVTLQGIYQLRVVMYQCHTPTCSRYHVRYHPEEEGSFALPHGEFGLDVIALIGACASGSIALSQRCINAYRPVVWRSLSERSRI